MDCPICGYKNLTEHSKFCIECNANIEQVSKPPGVQIEILQTLRDSEGIGINVKTINAETFVINSQSKLDNFKDSFCSLVEWMFEKSDSCSLKKLPSAYGKEVLQVIKKVQSFRDKNKYDYTDFEIKVLDIVFNFCHYYLNNAKSRSKEFGSFTKSDYYSYLKKLIKSGKKIRVTNIKLSLFIHHDDERMSKLVQALEQDK